MPQEDQRLSGALQENILTVLCFDDKHCKLVRAALTPHLFDSKVYREVSGHAINFIDQYGEAIKEHLPDHLEEILEGEDARKAESYKKLLENLYASRDSVNAEYVLSQLNKFVRLQHFKSGLVEAVQLLDGGGDIDQAEGIMAKAMKAQSVSFESGLDFSDAGSVRELFENPEEQGFKLGIKELDEAGIWGRRKELLAFLAPRKRGKSWFITHCAKQARLQRWKPLIITLEMSQKRYGARMLQSFFSISRRDAEQIVPRLEKTKDGQLEAIIEERVERMTMKDDESRSKLQARAKKEFSRGATMKIKEFPTGALDLVALEAYLDNLERFDNYVPDAIFIDYPRLMKLDAKNLRLELGATIAGIRAVAIKRNLAAIIVHQGNRASETAEWVTADMAEEDISLLATVDAIITYSQTAVEKKLGLARLMVDHARNEESKLQILITQAYGIGQFCLDSVQLHSNYWRVLDGKATAEERKEDRRAGAEDRRQGSPDRRSRPPEDGEERRGKRRRAAE